VEKQSNPKRYLFQASAFGIAGQIAHPFNDLIPVQAASTLPSVGGFGSARVDAFRYREILSFASAHSQVVGTEAAEGGVEIVSLSVVENYNLLDVVTCDRMVARLSSKYPIDSEPGSQPPESSILPIGSRFEGLRIGNHFFERLEVAPPYFCQPEHASWTGLCKAVEKDRGLLQNLSLPAPDGRPVPLPDDAQSTGLLGFCIALGEPKPGEVLGAPLRFEVPQFGTVHLGEFFCYPNARSLTLLRVELGCSHYGNVSGPEICIRSQPYP
jgi:hypothetical protein